MTVLKSDQNGRSMVEMLGVLAIIGVLSVGGISGYSKAMAKFKLTKAQDQISMLLMNIRTAFATSPNYSGLNNDAAIDYNIAPGDMVPDVNGTAINHAFGGAVTVKAEDPNSQYFSIQLDGLGNEACQALASSDWGTDGLVSLNGKTTSNPGTTLTTLGSATPAANLPITMFQAKDKGYCEKGKYSSLKWIYY